MVANDHRDGATFDPRDMVGTIYKEGYYTLLHRKYESSGPCGLENTVFVLISAHAPISAHPGLSENQVHKRTLLDKRIGIYYQFYTFKAY